MLSNNSKNKEEGSQYHWFILIGPGFDLIKKNGVILHYNQAFKLIFDLWKEG